MAALQTYKYQKGALIKALLAQENINDKTTLNPILEAEEIAKSSAKGYRESI